MTETPRAAFCPNCGAPTTGKFCALCGEAMQAPTQPSSSSSPPPAPHAPARAAAGAPAPEHRSHARAWTAFSLVAFLALALVFAGRSLTLGPAAPPDGGGMGAGPMAGGAASGAAPDISQMSPAERAERLHNLVLRAFGEHAMDTVQRFSPMAIAAYQMLDSMSLSQRYDLGRVALAAGQPALAAGQADTILARHRNDVLGLVLATDAARAGNDAAAERKFMARLRAAAPGGAAAVKGAEYAPYRSDIEATLGAGAGAGGS